MLTRVTVTVACLSNSLGGTVFGIDACTARVVWTAALVLAGLYCVFLVRTTLLVMLIAVLFSYLIYPLFVLAQRWVGGRIPRTALLGIVYLLVIVVVVIAVGLFGNTVADQAATLVHQLPTLLDPATLEKRLLLPHILEPMRPRLAGYLRDLLHGGSTSQALPFMRNVGFGLVHLASNLIYFVVVPILSFLMILQAPVIDGLIVTLGRKRDGGFWTDVLHGLNEVLSSYVRALALLSLATLVVYGVVLSLMGVPFALLLAGVAAVLEVIPVLGPLVAAGSIIGVALFSGYEHVAWVCAFIVAYRVFQDYMLNPYLMSEGVDVPPMLVVFGLLAGEELAGVAGIFLSVPFLAAVRMVAMQVRQHKAKLVREEPVAAAVAVPVAAVPAAAVPPSEAPRTR
jgi:predicted PurR-regulated permease PerM